MDVWCQDLASQIQGSDNSAALSGDQGGAEENNNGYEKYVIANATVATVEP